MTERAAAEAEAHVILLTWAEMSSVPPAWRERMLRVARALSCGCGVPCPPEYAETPEPPS